MYMPTYKYYGLIFLFFNILLFLYFISLARAITCCSRRSGFVADYYYFLLLFHLFDFSSVVFRLFGRRQRGDCCYSGCLNVCLVAVVEFVVFVVVAVVVAFLLFYNSLYFILLVLL